MKEYNVLFGADFYTEEPSEQLIRDIYSKLHIIPSTSRYRSGHLGSSEGNATPALRPVYQVFAHYTGQLDNHHEFLGYCSLFREVYQAGHLCRVNVWNKHARTYVPCHDLFFIEQPLNFEKAVNLLTRLASEQVKVPTAL